MITAIRDTLTQLQPLTPQETAPLQEKLVRDVRTGAIPLRSGDAPALDKAGAFRLPDGQILVAAPPANGSVDGDSVAVLYDTDGAISRHIETQTVTRLDKSVDLTMWMNDEAPVQGSITADEIHNTAAGLQRHDAFLFDLFDPVCALYLVPALVVFGVGLLPASIALLLTPIFPPFVLVVGAYLIAVLLLGGGAVTICGLF
ncbi:hypothetical protein [Nocardia sp. NPDC051570]|uniref:hypothetical protein n=1 Tax=Nocardia sp. NPDC051570 TaxID=3364324 RepID=UPI0037BAD11D